MTRIPNEQEIAYMLAHKSDSLVTNIIVCTAICGIASIVFVGLRFYAQWLTPGRTIAQESDWLMLVAWVFFAAFDIAFALTTRYGGGRHILFIEDARLLQIVRAADCLFSPLL
jgi:hypothetical protein